MQPKIITSITCVKCGGVMTGNESEFKITCPYCAAEYMISIAATIIEPVDIEEKIRLLVACVLDGNPRERNEAVLDLKKIKDARIIPPVIETMNALWKRMEKIGAYEELNPLYFALRNIIMLIEIPDAAENLITLLSDENPQYRNLAAEALRRIGNPSAIEPLIKAATDTDVSVRSSAVHALGSYQDERIPGVLMAALDDQSPRVIEAALRSVAQIKCVDAAGRVIDIFKTKTDRFEDYTSWDDVRKAAAWALSDIGTDDTVNTLIDAAEDDKPMILEVVMQQLQALRHTVKNDILKKKIEGILNRK